MLPPSYASSDPISVSPHSSRSCPPNAGSAARHSSPVCLYEDSEDKILDDIKADSERFMLYDSEYQPPHRALSTRLSSFWARMSAVRPFPSRGSSSSTLPLLPVPGNSPRRRPRWLRKAPRPYYCLLYITIGFFAMLGVIQFISLACGFAISFFPDEFDRAAERWREEKAVVPDISRWPTDISRDIVPVGCHSHNDYWRRVPLFSALEAGCIGVEADVWLFDNELFVGHTTSSLTPSRTLRTMYIDPLIRILDRQNPISHFHPDPSQPLNGVFDTDPSQSLILLIDFKTDGEETFHHVSTQLAPFRERGYLTHFNGTDVINGPITIVGTGNTPFNLVTANETYRDIFFDAPLDRLADSSDEDSDTAPHTPTARDRSTGNAGQGHSGIPAADIRSDTFDSTNSYYASVSFRKSIGYPWRFHLTNDQLRAIRAQIRGAHSRGLKARYWGTPSWPRSLRNHVWEVLVREGADILNVDDLESATKKDWLPKVFHWW